MRKRKDRWCSSSDSESDSEKIVKEKKQAKIESVDSHVSPTKPSISLESEKTPQETQENEDLSDITNGGHNYLVHGCRGVDSYVRINKIDEGTYGVVTKAKDRETGELVALKQVKMSEDVCKEGFPITALREANVLLALKHPNIIRVKEMVVGSTPDKIYMVMDYAENDLKRVMDSKLKKDTFFLQSEVKCLMKQLLSAIAYMHEHWFIHRDLKTSNILYDSKGKLTVCDFGLARKYGSPIRAFTHMVVTLWYRCPELLLGAQTYSTAVDMWSVGCIFAEIILLKPLFQSQGEIDALTKIFRLLGTPNEERWPDYDKLPNANNVKWKGPKYSNLKSKFPQSFSFSGGCPLSNNGFDLLSKLLELDPKKRISAELALQHEYFKEPPAPTPLELMPTFPGL